MKPNIAVLLVILTLLPTFTLSNPAKLSLKRSSSLSTNSSSLIKPPSDDNVDIQSYAGFYVNVDLQPKADSTGFSPSTVPMVLGLYTSTSLFTSHCENFVDFNTSAYSCTQYNNTPTTASFPYFQAQGYYLRTNAFLNNLYWTLNNNATYANLCTDGGAQAFGKQAYGILGMGFSDNSSTNYISSKYLFSVYFDEDGDGGQLLFDTDLSYASSTTPEITLTANNDWHVSGVSYVQMTDNYIPMNNGSIIFDINADSLGFPLDVYDTILTSFGTFGVQCPSPSSYYQPVCDYSGDIDDLPSLSISVENQLISISPEMYIVGGEADSGKITLDIKALDSSLGAAVNYVTPEFSNYIIIGFNLMKNYYIVFDGSSYAQNSNVIQAYPVDNSKAKNSRVLYIVGACLITVILLTIISLVYWNYVKKRKNKVTGTEEEKVDLQTAGSVPLLTEKPSLPKKPHFNSSLFPEEIYNEHSEDAYEESEYSSVQEQESKPYVMKQLAQSQKMGESLEKLRNRRGNTYATSDTKASRFGRTSVETDDSRFSLSKKDFNLSSDSIEP